MKISEFNNSIDLKSNNDRFLFDYGSNLYSCFFRFGIAFDRVRSIKIIREMSFITPIILRNRIRIDNQS